MSFELYLHKDNIIYLFTDILPFLPTLKVTAAKGFVVLVVETTLTVRTVVVVVVVLGIAERYF